jgi:hypothetical protein
MLTEVLCRVAGSGIWLSGGAGLSWVAELILVERC